MHKEPTIVAYQNTFNGFIAKNQTAEYQVPLWYVPDGYKIMKDTTPTDSPWDPPFVETTYSDGAGVALKEHYLEF